MKRINTKKHNKLSIALALFATLGLTSAFADSDSTDATIAENQNTLIDWSHKAQVALNKKLDDKLNEQLMQKEIPTQMAEAGSIRYQTANLVLAGHKLAHSNLAPLSSIPVVIIRNQKEDCLLNL